MQKILVVPDSFKGSLTSAQVCDILAEVFGWHFPGAQIVRVPLAGGGAGSAEAFLSAAGGEQRTVRVMGLYGEEVRALTPCCRAGTPPSSRWRPAPGCSWRGPPGGCSPAAQRPTAWAR